MTPRPTLIHVTTVDLSLHALLSNQLVRFAEEGFQVWGASAPGPYLEELAAAGIRHLPVPSLTRSWTPGRDVLAAAELRRLFRSRRPDIVHTHNPKSGALGRLAARVARVPIVVNTVHGLYANPGLPAVRRKLIRTAERWASRLSDHELYQSREDYSFAMRTRMVAPDRASWLGNGVDLRRFDPGAVTSESVKAIRKAWGVGQRTFVVGTVGRLVREKGYEELFEAARRIRGESTRAVPRFVVVGPEEPSKADRLAPAVLTAARANGVVFHGEGQAGEMPSIYSAFDLFALPSHREGVPRSAIEASAMARPLVATDIRGCREVVSDGVTGILIPVRNPTALAGAVRRLVENRAEARKMGKAARARAQAEFDEDRIIERTLRVYRRLLDRRGAGR
jgi:glycosyltransferase involved in cell wall biosynthesis